MIYTSSSLVTNGEKIRYSGSRSPSPGYRQWRLSLSVCTQRESVDIYKYKKIEYKISNVLEFHCSLLWWCRVSCDNGQWSEWGHMVSGQDLVSHVSCYNALIKMLTNMDHVLSWKVSCFLWTWWTMNICRIFWYQPLKVTIIGRDNSIMTFYMIEKKTLKVWIVQSFYFQF